MVFKGVGKTGCAATALVLAWTLIAPPVQASAAPAIYRSSGVILKTFPGSVRSIPGGVSFRLKTGRWLDVIDRPLVKDVSAPCLYAPALHVAALCETDGETTVTVLIDLISGRKTIAPGRPTVRPDAKLIVIGPSGKYIADSLTLVRITPAELVDEGGALFDDDFGPGGWADADCYRLKARRAGPDGWLEKTAAGWSQVSAAQSAICAKRHGG
jgi:hypothetical protein